MYAKIGISFSILGIIIMYTNAAIQNGLYAGTSLQPLSEVGFFSKKASYLNKDNIPVRAIVNMVCICIAVAVILLVIPEIIEGINLMPKMNGNRVHDIMEIHDYKAPFSVASLSQVTAVFAIITYASVIFSVLWCIFKQKSIKSNLFLNIAFIVCGIGLVFLIFSHYFFEVYDCINDKNDKSFLIKLVAEVIVLVGSYGFFAINYSIKRKSILNTY
ncbi:MAG: hypothetical protein LBB45_03985 [Methanobrevibacter sp.]|nr:hypothetical protein [Candidatus Methanovirga basalitermitum]